ncbi:MAG: hypothetical protein VX701_06700 [Chloroflexota bacterium]|nr:hypothetical protein [Chloroflexota bacterium]
MIWFRRALTFPLGVLLTISIFVCVGLVGFVDTFLNHDQIKIQLEESHVYDFVLNDVIESAINDLRDEDAENTNFIHLHNIVVDSGLSNQELVVFLNHIISSSYLQRQTEQVIDQMGPYISGETTTFQINILINEQVVVLISEVGRLLHESNAYELIIDHLAQEVIDHPAMLISESLGPERISKLLANVFPEEWVLEQLDSALISATPFIMGESDKFEGSVVLEDRLEILLTELKMLLAESDEYGLIYDNLIEPEIRVLVPNGIQYPLGFTITTQEILTALRSVVTPKWLRSEAENLIDQLPAYFLSEVDSLSILLSIHKNKSELSRIIADIVNHDIEEKMNSVPSCTPSQLALFRVAQLDSIPRCLPQVLDRQAVIGKLTSGTESSVRSLLASSVPDELIFTENDIGLLFNSETGHGTNVTSETLPELRHIITNGWNYDQDTAMELVIDFLGEYRGQTNSLGQINLPSSLNWDHIWFKAINSPEIGSRPMGISRLDDYRQNNGKLLFKVGQDSQDQDSVYVTFYRDEETVYDGLEIWIFDNKNMELLRALISEGWQYDEIGLRKDLQVVDAPNLERGLNLSQKYVGFGMKYRPILYIPMLVLILVIGLLGGRNWKTRLRWASAHMILSSLTVYLVLGPMNYQLLEFYDKFAGDAFTDVKSMIWDFAYQQNIFYQTQTLVIDKMYEVIRSMTHSFIQEVAKKSLILSVLSCLCFALSLPTYRRRKLI